MDEQNQVERRMIADAPGIEVKKDQNGRTVIRGYAAVYDSDSQDLGGFVERIAPGAFNKVLESNPDVFGRYNHDRLLGRTSSGTVRLFPDERGLRYEIDPKPADADLIQSLERGDVRGSSFSFRSSGSDEHWYKDNKGRMIREIRSFSFIGDVGPVDEPAYRATEAYVSKRALAMAQSEALAPSENPGVPEVEDEDIEDPLLNEQEAPNARSDEAVVETAEEDTETEDRAVNLKPTEGMASAARRGLELHKEGKSGDGLKPETVARANRLARREEMNRDWVVEMNAWFKRHESSKTEGWDKAPDYSPAYVAWLLWGGNPGRSFAARKVAELERAGERSADEVVETAEVTAESCGETQTAASVVQEDFRGKIASLKATVLRTKLHDK
jgi:HK97 family phage prohead protease